MKEEKDPLFFISIHVCYLFFSLQFLSGKGPPISKHYTTAYFFNAFNSVVVTGVALLPLICFFHVTDLCSFLGSVSICANRSSISYLPYFSMQKSKQKVKKLTTFLSVTLFSIVLDLVQLTYYFRPVFEVAVRRRFFFR